MYISRGNWYLWSVVHLCKRIAPLLKFSWNVSEIVHDYVDFFKEKWHRFRMTSSDKVYRKTAASVNNVIKWWCTICAKEMNNNYSNVIMSAIAYQITGVLIVCSTIYSGIDQGIHPNSASLDFVRGTHGSPVDSPHKGPVMRKMFQFDDVILIP